MLTTSRRNATYPALGRRDWAFTLVWDVFVAVVVAVAACTALLGRSDLLQPSVPWATLFVVIFVLGLIWLVRFGGRLAATPTQHPGGPLRTSVAIHAPLAALSLAAIAAIYLSDQLNHQVAYFLQPTAPLLVLLAVLATIVAQRTAIIRAEKPDLGVREAILASREWVIPISLALLGLLQAGSYILVIGNDFTRYWNVADAIRSWSGYPTITNLPIYIQIGEPRYCTDLPGLSLLLIPAFGIAGHDTLGAALPNLLANVALPVLLYVFYRGAGISRVLAFAGSCALVTQPFYRLYTLNAPVPDPLFLALLTATAIAFQRVISRQSRVASRESRVRRTQGSGLRTPTRHSSLITHHPSRVWLLFGLLAGAITLTRPEGIFFLGFMGLALLPNLRSRGPYLAAAVFLTMVLPFVAVMYTTFGFLWPNNAGTTFGLQHVATNIHWLQEKTLRWYADAFGMSIPQLLALLGFLAAGIVVGSAWLVRRQWKLVVLPIGALVNLAVVFAVDPTVSGVHLWFDFFRHISYGLHFLLLPLLFLLDALTEKVVAALRSRGTLKVIAANAAAVLLLLISFYQLNVLSHPSQTFGGSAQLLTSDIWVSLQDLVAHRYELPQVPFARNQEGLLVVEPSFDRTYEISHLDYVNRFFEPYSAINVNRGGQYELSSALVLLLGSLFALLAAKGNASST